MSGGGDLRNVEAEPFLTGNYKRRRRHLSTPLLYPQDIAATLRLHVDCLHNEVPRFRRWWKSIPTLGKIGSQRRTQGRPNRAKRRAVSG